MPAKSWVNFTLRLPPEVSSALVDEARQTDKSQNQIIVDVLLAHFAWLRDMQELKRQSEHEEEVRA